MSAATRVPEISRHELPEPPEFDRSRIVRRLVALGALIVVVVAAITLVPGLASLRSRFAHAQAGWLVLGCVLKVLSGLAYVAVFRAVFCRRLSWRLSTQIGLSELGANAVVPTGGVGGLALGAWALRRAGMSTERIARRSVAFFFLTSVPNVVGVIVLGFGMALGVFEGPSSLALTLVPGLLAAGAIVLTIMGGRWAGRAEQRAAARREPHARLPRVLGTISGGVEESLALLRQHNPWLIAGLIGYLGFDVMILWSTFHAFGSSPPLSIMWLGYLIGELGGLLPVPGGIGGVELGLVGTLVLYKVPVGAATAAVIGYRAIALWVPAVLGSLAFVLLRRSLSREAIAISSCEPGDEVSVIGRGIVRVNK
ncbi:MAG TPA: lysylphosphatidylglycerol synthase transmembrane domain-containing protein [Solirubrobacteraceae bacterium]|jgi:uncharacterized protein (TIRG00374 family)|nr:lysylphosphatidylglycerol synthase transmembrane domain-containing protein [Solirubrobacteraceae bacterium]